MIKEDYSQMILNSIEPDAIDCSDDNETILLLEEQMDKYGSLHENSIDWQRAEEAALLILNTHCKNMRVMAHLMVCLHHSRDGERYILSLRLLGEFLENFWESSYPLMQPVSRALTIKRKILKQILLRSEQAAKRLDLTEGDSALRKPLAEAVEKLKHEVEKTKLGYDDYWKITNEFDKALPADLATPEQVVTVATGESKILKAKAIEQDQVQEQSETSPKQSGISIPEIKLQDGNERETKQTLFKVATLLNSMNPNDPLGYRVRRFALWLNISTMPMMRKDGKTEMMAISQDRVTEYLDSLNSAPSNELLIKIEHSISVSPFWINGSYISSRVADALDMKDVSEAIKEEAIRFTRKLPELLESKFSNGSLFVDAATRQWLVSTNGKTKSSGTGNIWTEKLQQALQIASDGQYKKAMSILENGACTAEQPRDQLYWRLATADFMHNTEMTTLAKAEYQSLLLKAEELDVQAWEPLLFEELKQKAEL